jgi:hypothetical protein
MSKTPTPAPSDSTDRADIDAFLQRARTMAPGTAGKRGRLVFGLDATMSRQPTWDRATAVQAEMFKEAAAVGGLDIKLVYFRGFGECRASPWVSDGDRLGRMMSSIDCRGGLTQIRKVLGKALEEAREAPVQALVYVGDAMEEDVDMLCARAGELGLLKVPVFLFQERREPAATAAFAEIARLSGGAHLTFSDASGAELAKLLKAVAVYAAGGRKALEARRAGGDEGARLLIEKLR